jgi:hypothetical protein
MEKEGLDIEIVETGEMGLMEIGDEFSRFFSRSSRGQTEPGLFSVTAEGGSTGARAGMNGLGGATILAPKDLSEDFPDLPSMMGEIGDSPVVWDCTLPVPEIDNVGGAPPSFVGVVTADARGVYATPS